MNNKQQLINIITNNTSKKLINIEINKEIESFILTLSLLMIQNNTL